ncbi:MAG: PQQ-dependent sugar dehydrogenase [Thermoleophilia bacterium]|nr:PQQ-dependent sugar dehydrogenase [Thermoleophilia bacterium]
MFASTRGTVVAAGALGTAAVLAVGCGSSAPSVTSADTATPTTVPTATAQATAASGGLRLRRVAAGLADALFVTSAPGRAGELYVVQQSGRIRVVRGGRVLPRPFLDISRSISSGGERGLLGLAFDPGFARNRRFYVHYTDPAGNTRVARYTARPTPAATAATGRVILRQQQPYPNHNGGMLAFGPDGMLYVGLGDGGSAGDPENRAQDLSTLLGKILRIDVRGNGGYRVPPDNPFARTAGARGEIWHYGLRNPWRFSFDRTTGDLWIADVGQNAIEEIDRAPAGRGGLNFGWNAWEGRSRFDGGPLRPGSTPTPPVAQYTHASGVSVTGGYVYRGTAIPALRGRYVYADYGSGRVWTLRAAARPGAPREETRRLGARLQGVTSFGEDAAGGVYVIANQSLYRFTR